MSSNSAVSNENDSELERKDFSSNIDLNNIQLPHILKNKLLFSVGKHNGINFTADELSKMAAFPASDLYIQHLDTKGQAVQSYIGKIVNIHFSASALYGDLEIVNRQQAINLAHGAKFGLSPSVHFKKDIRNGEVFAINPLAASYSLVDRPSDMLTMLNNDAQQFEAPVCFAKELDPQAKVRQRGDVVFPSNSPKVKDNKDHFPINDIGQARNALARAGQYDKVPPWYNGTLEGLKEAIRRAVRKKFPSVKISEVKNMSEENENQSDAAPAEGAKEETQKVEQPQAQPAPVQPQQPVVQPAVAPIAVTQTNPDVEGIKDAVIAKIKADEEAAKQADEKAKEDREKLREEIRKEIEAEGAPGKVPRSITPSVDTTNTNKAKKPYKDMTDAERLEDDRKVDEGMAYVLKENKARGRG